MVLSPHRSLLKDIMAATNNELAHQEGMEIISS